MRNGAGQNSAAELGEFGHGGGGGFGGIERDFFLRQDRPVVHLLVHEDDCHSRFGLPVQDRRLNRGSAAVFGEKRGMDVEGTFFGQLQNLLRNNHSVGSDNEEIRLQSQ